MIDMQELDHARVRWQLGHHLFFSYVQSLIIVCTRLVDELAEEDWIAARQTIEDATHLLWGVSVNFKLTGDFSQAAYEGYVRPNMFEASEGFSGLWSQDHDYLVKAILRKLKPTFQNPPPELASSVRTFQQAFAIMYDSHKYVCERFEGSAPSLLMGDDAQKSAGQMIETFKQNRLRTLGVR
ncbi:MAG: hypothetical protein AAF614_16445 [Chloroflexota bacterium]